MRYAILLLLLTLCAFPAFAQTGTPHGIALSWNASTSTVVGYNVYRCPGTCTLTSTWTRIATLTASTSYLDPASGLSAGAAYSYVSTAQDASSNESSFSNIATVAVPSSGFPSNPASPTGMAGKIQ